MCRPMGVTGAGIWAFVSTTADHVPLPNHFGRSMFWILRALLPLQLMIPLGNGPCTRSCGVSSVTFLFCFGQALSENDGVPRRGDPAWLGAFLFSTAIPSNTGSVRPVFFLSEKPPVSDIPSKIYCHALALGVGFSLSEKTLWQTHFIQWTY
jgi:hypothetical protein